MTCSRPPLRHQQTTPPARMKPIKPTIHRRARRCNGVFCFAVLFTACYLVLRRRSRFEVEHGFAGLEVCWN